VADLKQELDIRVLTPDDVVPYKSLRTEAATDPSFGITPEAEAAYTAALLTRTLIDSYLAFTLGAFLGDDLVGMVGFGRGVEDDSCTLYGLFVTEEQRRAGIGRVLVEAFLDEAKRREVKTVSLKVSDDNVRAIPLYLSLGFRPDAGNRMVRQLSDESV
jgi:ribosomal protein S18 acetylase RimI-like enzyme